LNVSGLLFSGGYTQNNQFGLTIDYPELIRQLLTRWLQRVDYEVWLIPHVVPDNMPVEDDRRAIQVLQQAFPQVHCAPDFATPSEAKAFIAGMDFMTGARMHACIAAFSSGVPVVPVAYSRKFNGLFQSLKYRWFADGKSMTTEQVVDLIEQGLANRALLKQEVLAGNAIASRLLLDYEQYLSLCMRGLRT
jgi:polysaccharide pyruvyl transferase WcaK-like protein